MQYRIQRSAEIKASFKALPLIDVLQSAEGTVDERRATYCIAISSAVMRYWEGKVMPFLETYCETQYGTDQAAKKHTAAKDVPRAILLEAPLLLPADLVHEFQCTVVTPAALVMDQMNSYLPVHHVGCPAGTDGTQQPIEQRYGDAIASEVWQQLSAATRGSSGFIKNLQGVAESAGEGLATLPLQDAYAKVEEMRAIYNVARSFFSLCAPLVDTALMSQETTQVHSRTPTTTINARVSTASSLCNGIQSIFKDQLAATVDRWPPFKSAIRLSLQRRVAVLRSKWLPFHVASTSDKSIFADPELTAQLAYLKVCLGEYVGLMSPGETEAAATLSDLEVNIGENGDYIKMIDDAQSKVDADLTSGSELFPLSGCTGQHCPKALGAPTVNVPRTATAFSLFGDRCKAFETKLGNALLTETKHRALMVQHCHDSLFRSSFFTDMVLPELLSPKYGVLVSAWECYDTATSATAATRCRALYKVSTLSLDLMLPVVAKIIVRDFCLDANILKDHFFAPGQPGEFVYNNNCRSRPRRTFAVELPFTREEAAFTLVSRFSFFVNTVLSKLFGQPTSIRLPVYAELRALLENPIPAVFDKVLTHCLPRLTHSKANVGLPLTQLSGDTSSSGVTKALNEAASGSSLVDVGGEMSNFPFDVTKDHPMLTTANSFYTFDRLPDITAMTWAEEATFGHRVWMHPDTCPKTLLELEEVHSPLDDFVSRVHTIYGSMIPMTFGAKGCHPEADSVRWGGPRSLMGSCTANWSRTIYGRLAMAPTFHTAWGQNVAATEGDNGAELSTVTDVREVRLSFGTGTAPLEVALKKLMRKTHSGNTLTETVQDALNLGVLVAVQGNPTSARLGDVSTLNK